MATALTSEHAASAVFIHYPSGSPNAPAFEAGFEQHKVLGRFHHIEVIVLDFGL